MVRRAAFDLDREFSAPSPTTLSTCRYLPDEPSGTTPKFQCVLDDGQIVKVKYGRNPEMHAEVAATGLLRMLGYPIDTVVMVPLLRCYGCPRFPFAGAYVMTHPVTRHLLANNAEGYTDFEWVAVERRFPARPIETDTVKGWSWWEMERGEAAGRADLDAIRLLAVFLGHWDNKSENQRLVCLDKTSPSPTGSCRRPLALIQDLGGTFGPVKVNLGSWRALPVWHDRATCTVSMRALPYGGASFGDAVISEEGRAQLAARLETITDDHVRRLFADARFPQFQSGTDDEKDLEAWTAAFRHRVNQIVDRGPCPNP